jgi:hypothetical protein
MQVSQIGVYEKGKSSQRLLASSMQLYFLKFKFKLLAHFVLALYP